ncbi:MAG: hypothetical protein IT290_09140, partial [Deltaproteobacteria bacterium]|nr:hypothetical protein [Deltaproteobacteria bacterium]
SARAVEFRFATTGAEARNNLVDTPLGTRDGATFAQSGNVTNASAAFFVGSASGDLHLVSGATTAINQASAVPSVTNDIDGATRPVGVAPDVGADEFGAGGSDVIAPSAPTNFRNL